MIKPNLAEAESVLNKRLNSLQAIVKATKYFHQKGISIVAITMGSKGAVVSNDRDIIFAKPPRIKRKNPVGCGDAFIAGFLYAYSNSIRFATSVKSAVACGAANAISITPGSISRRQLQKTLSRVRLERL
jgi:fructose-1-phosphate kinase PfkB-like protein